VVSVIGKMGPEASEIGRAGRPGDQDREKNSTESFYLTAKEAKRAKKESVSEGVLSFIPNRGSVA
jgi:hypothetical protein